MRALLLLLLSALALAAQEATEPEYLFVNRNAAKQVLAAIDADYGYPNPATKTDTAVQPIYHPTETWALIPLDLVAIYAPKQKKGLLLRIIAQAKVSANDFQLVTTSDGVRLKDPFCRIPESVAKQLGFFPDAKLD